MRSIISRRSGTPRLRRYRRRRASHCLVPDAVLLHRRSPDDQGLVQSGDQCRRTALVTAMLAALTSAATASAGPAPDGGIWSACDIRSVSICAEEGCSPAKPAISIYLSNFMDGGRERAAYYRCAPALTKCDRYNAVVYRTGEFTIFSLPARSLFAKLGPDEKLVDVAAVDDRVYISRGSCRHAAPPAASELRSR